MEQHTLTRTGMAPLKFTGELLEESDGERQSGKEHSRYHDLAVYKSGDRYVVAINFRTKWQGELDRDAAEVVDKPEAVVFVLRDYDPCAGVTGYPAGAAYAERQARLMADIRNRYESQVSELLATAPEFAEEIS